MNYQQPTPFHMPVEQMVHIDYRNPPVLPMINYSVMYIDQQTFQQYYPFLVVKIIDAIQKAVNIGPLRVYMFNQMAQNGYNNAAFTDFIQFAVMAVDRYVGEGRYPDIHAAIEDLTPNLVNMRCAVNATVEQQLLNMATSPQALQADIHMYGQLVLKLNSPMQRPQHQQQFQQPIHQQYSSPIANNGFNQRQMQQPMNTFRPIQNTAPVYTNNQAFIQGNKFNQPVQQTRSFTPNAPAASFPKPFVNTAPVMPFNNTNQKLENIKWIPSDAYPYLPVYDPNEFELMLTNENGLVKPLITKKRTFMDQSQHLQQPSFATTQSSLSPQESRNHSNLVVNEALEMKKDLSNPSFSQTDIAKKMLNVNKEPVTISLLAVEEGILYNDIQIAAMAHTPNKLRISQTVTTLVDTEVAKSNVSDVVIPLIDCDNLLEAAKHLKELHNKIETTGETETYNKESLGIINKRLCNSFNLFIKNELAQTGTITDFANDVEDAIIHYGSKGDTIVSAITSNGIKIIRRALTQPNAESTKAMDEYYYSEKYDGVYVNYFITQFTITNVDCHSSELKFEISDPKIANGVTESMSPVLYALVDAVFLYTTTFKIENKRHLIKTNDGVIFEVNRGALNNSYYLVSLFKK